MNIQTRTKWRASFILNIVLAGALLYTLFHYNAFSNLQHKASDEEAASPYYQARNDVFSTTTGPSGGTIFIGDSLTDMNEWEEAFPGRNIKNRGIYGDTTQGVLKRLDPIISQKPDAIFIMIGINDLAAKTDKGTILKNYEKIIRTLNDELPDTEIHIQSLLPNHEELNTKASIENEDIIQINSQLQELAQEQGVGYIDLYSGFEDEDGQLAKNYTVDGVHLNGEGYKIWEEKISQYLK